MKREGKEKSRNKWDVVSDEGKKRKTSSRVRHGVGEKVKGPLAKGRGEKRKLLRKGRTTYREGEREKKKVVDGLFSVSAVSVSDCVEVSRLY